MVAHSSTSRRADQLILLAILLVAFILRFRYLLQIEHNADHAYPIYQAMQTLDRGRFPLVGQGTSVLFANPPGTGYVFLPIVALTRSPLGVYLFVIALNWLAVWFCYRGARTLIGSRRALVAAGLMAVNPWAIEYSRTSWVQSMLPFFVCAVAWLLWPVLMGQARRPIRRTILALGMATLLTETYLLAFLIAAPVTVLIVVFRRRVPMRAVAVGMVIFTAATTLYGIGLIQQWDAVKQRVTDFSAAEPHIKREAWDAAVRLVTGAEYEVARGLDAPIRDVARRHDLSSAAHDVLLVMLLVGVGGAIVAVIKPPRHKEHEDVGTRHALSLRASFQQGINFASFPSRDAAVVVLVWFFIPVLAMTYTGNPVHPFYQFLGAPAGYVLAAWGLGSLFRPETRIGGWLLVVTFIPFGLLMSINSARYYQETAALPGAHRLSAISLEAGLWMGRAIDERLPDGGVVYGEEIEWILNSFAGRTFPVIRDARAPLYNAIPREGGVYVAFAEGDPPVPAGAADEARLDMPDGTALAVYTLVPAAEYLIDSTITIPSQQGITLIDYDLQEIDAAANQWELTTVWRVDFVAPDVPGRLFGPFIHVFNEAGERILIVDGQVVAGELWRAGDLHVHRMSFSVPPGVDFSLLIGQYDGVHNANVIFLPPDEEPTVVIPIPVE